MENPNFTAKLEVEHFCVSKGIKYRPRTLINLCINSENKRNSTAPSIMEEKNPATNLQLSETQLMILQARKNNLFNECAQLEKDIQEKRKSLSELKHLLSSTSNDCTSSSASKLAAGLAHEIRNPLTTIKGFIQLLKPELNAIGKEEFTEVVLEEINRANDLLSEFLTVFKPSTTVKRKVSVNNVINSMGKLFSSEATLKQIEFTSDVTGAEVNAFGDEKQLKQVLINLLKNAFEAVEDNGSEKGRVVSLTLRSFNESSEITVSDNGCGIEEQAMNKMFTPFYTTKQKGTGIGLVICKQIIEEHGGSLSVNSTPIGGTIFQIKLPLY